MIDLDALEALLEEATLLPWTDRTKEFRERHALYSTRTDTWRARPGHHVRQTWVRLITGPPRAPYFHLDEWDYPHVIALQWSSIKGDALGGFMRHENAELIIAAVNALPELIRELRELRAGLKGTVQQQPSSERIQ